MPGWPASGAWRTGSCSRTRAPSTASSASSCCASRPSKPPSNPTVAEAARSRGEGGLGRGGREARDETASGGREPRDGGALTHGSEGRDGVVHVAGRGADRGRDRAVGPHQRERRGQLLVVERRAEQRGELVRVGRRECS